VWREGLQGLERFVHGVPVLTLDPSKRGATDQQSETVRDTALAKLKIMRKGHGYALNAGETLDFKEPGGVGNQMVMGFLEYIDRCLMAAITGAALKSGGDSTSAGSYASDQVGADMQDTVVQYDRDKVDEDLSTDLIGLLCRLNRPQFKKLEEISKIPGLADEPDPVFTTVVKKRMDPMTELQIVQGASQVKGLDLPADEVYERIGYSMPEEDEEVFKGGSAIQEQPQVDPETGLPLPPGMPEPSQPNEPEEDNSGPEDNDELFGSGSPEDDETLFNGSPAEGPGVSGGVIDDEVTEDPFDAEEEMYPERELIDPPTGDENLDEEPVASPEDITTEADDSVDEPEPSSKTEKVAESAARKAVQTVKGNPSSNVEIEGMEEQRDKAKEGNK
jgi:hypothetical protein